MKTTQKKIADILNISVSTVSRALQDSPKVKQATREKIKLLSTQLNYHPSEIARSLVLQKSRTVGIVLQTMSHSFYAELGEQIIHELYRRQYLGIVLSVDKTTRKEMIRSLLSRSVDGLVANVLNLEEMAILNDRNVPFVLFTSQTGDTPPALPYDYVATDRHKGACLAMEHLIGLGYTTIGFLCLNDKMEGRFIGYIETLARHGLRAKPEWIVPGLGFYQDGYDGMRQLLALPERPRAIFAMNDLAAIGALKAVRDVGLRVPEDVAVVGFDNISESEYIELTTVEQPRPAIAAHLVSMLLEKINGANAPYPPRHILLEPKLIIRKTCGAQQKIITTRAGIAMMPDK